jgi:anti-sigma regulatory factor (Ser/Thr protein kinase)
VFPGHPRELAPLRRWLTSLLPECPARDDVVSVANELGGNAVEHTASGRPGGWFAVEITWHPSVVQVAVADCGGPAEPRVIDDPGGERGRGLLVVQRLSLRTGYTGDHHGRLVWAQCAWHDPHPAAPAAAQDPYQATVRAGEAALARRFADVPAWFGHATMAWWALAGTAGLVSAPTASELAGLLYRLLEPLPRRSERSPGRRTGDSTARLGASGASQADPRDRRHPGVAGADIGHVTHPAGKRRDRRPTAAARLVTSELAAGVSG